MMIFVKVALAFFVLLLSGCQISPTKTTENLTVGPNPDSSRIITEKTVILDTRPLFAYSSGHLPIAQPIRWDFYGHPQNPGLLRGDLHGIARELSRVGVAPDRHVLVVGLGKGGLGEEGRVAWMLSYLGVKNVAFAREGFFAMKRVTGKAASAVNAPVWLPTLNEKLIVTKAELTQAMKTANGNYRLIDVRPIDEYLGRNPDVPKQPDIGAVNIPWSEFIDENGFPRKKIASQLAAIGITAEKRVIVISEEGVRSGLVTHVLTELGYENAGNFAGGYRELFSTKKRKN